MPNTIKCSSDGLALQVTKSVRAAKIVEETDTTRLANIRVFAFDGLLLGDIDHITVGNVVELATSTALDTISIHCVADASLQIVGNAFRFNYQMGDAGFHAGDRAPCTPAPNMLVIAAERSERIAADLVTIRRDQV